MESVFEAVGYEEDEVYFALGLWPNLEAAIEAIECHESPVNLSDQNPEDNYLVEVRERKLGVYGIGSLKATISWKENLNKEKGGCGWVRGSTVRL